MADLQTIEEKIGNVAGKKIAWFGDYNNVARSFKQASKKFGFEFIAAVPPALHLKADMDAHITDDAEFAAKDADVIVTDTWVSMGQEGEKASRVELFGDYRVTAELMGRAKSDAIFLHCLPAYREFEVAAEVIDGPQSVVWDEAENRVHAQKALMSWLLAQA